MVAIIRGSFVRYRPLVDKYHEARPATGWTSESLRVGIHPMPFVGKTGELAWDTFFSWWESMFTGIARGRWQIRANRSELDQMCAKYGPFLIGSVQTIRNRVRVTYETLGAVSAISCR